MVSSGWRLANAFPEDISLGGSFATLRQRDFVRNPLFSSDTPEECLFPVEQLGLTLREGTNRRTPLTECVGASTRPGISQRLLAEAA